MESCDITATAPANTLRGPCVPARRTRHYFVTLASGAGFEIP